MLQPAAVAPRTLELLKELMALPALEQFVLVGGTNLALRLGHRLSIDFDLFTEREFDTEYLYSQLEQAFSGCELVGSRPGMLFTFVENIKTDLIRLPYPLIQPIEIIDGIRMASMADIAAMKLAAVSQRGAKKDFWDVAELLDHFTLTDMVAFFKQKYGHRDAFYVLRSLVYFEDAESSKDPDVLKPASWQTVKQKIEQRVKAYIDTHS
jgi:hypothetical protein